jgi:hypothetical protein
VWNRGIGRGCCGSGYELELAGDFEQGASGAADTYPTSYHQYELDTRDCAGELPSCCGVRGCADLLVAVERDSFS